MGKCFRLREAGRHEWRIQVIERKSEISERKSLCDRRVESDADNGET